MAYPYRQVSYLSVSWVETVGEQEVVWRRHLQTRPQVWLHDAKPGIWVLFQCWKFSCWTVSKHIEILIQCYDMLEMKYNEETNASTDENFTGSCRSLSVDRAISVMCRASRSFNRQRTVRLKWLWDPPSVSLNTRRICPAEGRATASLDVINILNVNLVTLLSLFLFQKYFFFF